METTEKVHGVKLPSGAVIAVENKNDSERIRNSFKMYGEITDGIAKKLASFVANHKGEVLKDVVAKFQAQFSLNTMIPELVEG